MIFIRKEMIERISRRISSDFWSDRISPIVGKSLFSFWWICFGFVFIAYLLLTLFDNSFQRSNCCAMRLPIPMRRAKSREKKQTSNFPWFASIVSSSAQENRYSAIIDCKQSKIQSRKLETNWKMKEDELKTHQRPQPAQWQMKEACIHNITKRLLIWT